MTSVEERTFQLEPAIDFFGLAARQWLAKRFMVQLDPWKLLREDRDAR